MKKKHLSAVNPASPPAPPADTVAPKSLEVTPEEKAALLASFQQRNEALRLLGEFTAQEMDILSRKEAAYQDLQAKTQALRDLLGKIATAKGIEPAQAASWTYQVDQGAFVKVLSMGCPLKPGLYVLPHNLKNTIPQVHRRFSSKVAWLLYPTFMAGTRFLVSEETIDGATYLFLGSLERVLDYPGKGERPLVYGHHKHYDEVWDFFAPHLKPVPLKTVKDHVQAQGRWVSWQGLVETLYRNGSISKASLDAALLEIGQLRNYRF
jgi:hypothetical protein